ncbi:MAG: hypothetical protein AB1545_04655 [Thermodesulfobacteriota bacterium]
MKRDGRDIAAVFLHALPQWQKEIKLFFLATSTRCSSTGQSFLPAGFDGCKHVVHKPYATITQSHAPSRIFYKKN